MIIITKLVKEMAISIACTVQQANKDKHYHIQSMIMKI